MDTERENDAPKTDIDKQVKKQNKIFKNKKIIIPILMVLVLAFLIMFGLFMYWLGIQNQQPSDCGFVPF